MHPRITELLTYVDRETSALREVYESVPPRARSVRSDPARWSPAEIVHHLAMVDQRIVGLLGKLIDQARELPPETETSPLLPNDLVARVLNRSRRFKTSQASEPLRTDADRVWDELMATRRGLVDVVAAGDGLALGSVSAPHPAFGPFNGYEWIMFLGAHAARHAEQMLEMRQLPS